MTLELDLQIALDMPGLPAESELRRWAEAALAGAGYRRDAELTIRVVNEAESTALNETYRHKQGPTNVLSFPFEAPPESRKRFAGRCRDLRPGGAARGVQSGKTGRGALGASGRAWRFAPAGL
jgi:probable rRNA maturation factor